MKILHVIAQLPSRTGSGVYFSNMVEEFKKYGYDQKVIFGNQDNFPWDILDEDHIYSINFKTESLPFPIVGMSDVMPYENTKYSDMTEDMFKLWTDGFRQRLEEVKKDFKPDLIFGHHLWILTSILREVFPDTKIIGLCHNTDLRQARMNPKIKESYVKNIDKLDYIFSASEEQKKEIVEIYGADIKKIVAVGGGFNQNIFYASDKVKNRDKIKLVFCAKIDPSKGIYELIEVYKSLNLSDISLDIIGAPNEENKTRVESMIKDDPSIRMYNVKDQLALGDELREKDIFIMPSYYEGLGLMAIESLACGLYVVTSEIEALMTLLGDRVRDSGVIKYTPLPNIYDTDKPLTEELPKFKEDLKLNILDQIDKVRRGLAFPEEIREEIKSHSWEGLVGEMNKFIVENI